MSIEPFVSQDYATVDAYEAAATVRHSALISKAVVVTEEDIPIGILSAADLAAKQYKIVIDCLTEKPTVEIRRKASDVLEVMDSSGHNVLMVYDQNRFVGVISQNDLMHHLQSNLGLQKLKVQSAAHDLKNPLASIHLIATMLQDSLVHPQDRQLVDYLMQSCGHAQRIVDDILLTEQIAERALVASEEDFDAVVGGCLAHFSLELSKKRIRLVAELNFGGTVSIDRAKLERAIHNLISNAIKFSHENGTIVITTQRTGSMAQLTIKDSGIGIPASLHEHVFERFTKARRTGTAGEPPTGLGMFITKQIVELHGGQIELNSDGRTGTDVSIFLFATEP